MKPLFLFICLVFSLKTISNAQVSASDKSITFYGLDFSKSKMVGNDGFSNPDDIVNRIFGEWNNLLVNEKSKYDVKFAFNKSEVDYDFDIVNKRNLGVSASTLVTNNSYGIDEKIVASIIKSYSPKSKKLGIVLIVEKFDKTEEKASLFITYFNPTTKKVLLTKRMTAAPVGFGFRNYWAGAIAKILKQSNPVSGQWEAASK